MLTQRRLLDIRGDHDKQTTRHVLTHGARLVGGVLTRLILSGRRWVPRRPGRTRDLRSRTVAERRSLLHVGFQSLTLKFALCEFRVAPFPPSPKCFHCWTIPGSSEK